MKKHALLSAMTALLLGVLPLSGIPTEVTAAESSEKLIALTFDDGPNTTTTNEILDLLELYDASASFFLIGTNINEESAVTVKRAYDMGCEINNHSKSHGNMGGLTPEEIEAEIQYVNDAVYEIIGEYPKFFRPPFIDVSQTMYDTIDLPFICGLDTRDFMADVTAQQRADTIISSAKDGLIVLCHDAAGNTQTVEALEIVLPTLQAEGYEFVTLTELFERQGETPRGNMIYNQVTKYPCTDYVLQEELYSGELTGDSSSQIWGENTALDGAALTALGDSYAIEVAYDCSNPPVIALQKWSDGVSLWDTVQPSYYNGERACFLATDLLTALEQHDVTYTDLDKLAIVPHAGTMTITEVKLLVRGAASAAQMGDVDQNGTVQIADIILLQKYLLGAASMTDAQAALADLDQDGVLKAFDLAILKNKVLQNG